MHPLPLCVLDSDTSVAVKSHLLRGLTTQPWCVKPCLSADAGYCLCLSRNGASSEIPERNSVATPYISVWRFTEWFQAFYGTISTHMTYFATGVGFLVVDESNGLLGRVRL